MLDSHPFFFFKEGEGHVVVTDIKNILTFTCGAKFLNIILKYKEMFPEFREATHKWQFLYLWKFICS